MRIRKNSKMSAVFLSSSSSLSSSDILFRCQLNQSPWDVITFSPSDSSPPPYQTIQFDRNESFNGNGSLADSIGAVESIGSMKLALEVEETDREIVEEREEKQGGVNLCCKTDGKQWQCKREAQKNQTMCDYHLAQIKNYNTLAHPSVIKSSSNKPVRTRKASTASPSNPNEFYYYSGFGPSWGKKRDIGHSLTNKRDKEAVEHVKVTVPLRHSSSDEIDDDDDDDEEDMSVSGKKRRRKPIKARSLKDLCEGMG